MSFWKLLFAIAFGIVLGFTILTLFTLILSYFMVGGIMDSMFPGGIGQELSYLMY